MKHVAQTVNTLAPARHPRRCRPPIIIIVVIIIIIFSWRWALKGKLSADPHFERVAASSFQTMGFKCGWKYAKVVPMKNINKHIYKYMIMAMSLAQNCFAVLQCVKISDNKIALQDVLKSVSNDFTVLFCVWKLFRNISSRGGELQSLFPAQWAPNRNMIKPNGQHTQYNLPFQILPPWIFWSE